MGEARLAHEFKRLYKALAFFWKDKGFHLTYIASGYDGHSREMVIDLESKACKLLFDLDHCSPPEKARYRVGKRSACNSRLPVCGLIYWYPFAELLVCPGGAPYKADNNTKTDLETLSHSLYLHMEALLELLKAPKRISEKLKQPHLTHGNPRP